MVAHSKGPIPAYAGETKASSTCSSFARAYPRIRGGNPFVLHVHARDQGLSPHTRGKHVAGLVEVFSCGPIPAYAGETKCFFTGPLSEGAYPRIRGGNRWRHVWVHAHQGLSPHTRGKPHERLDE